MEDNTMIFGRKTKEIDKEANLHWHNVKSSFVEAVAYDGKSGDLYVTLANGSYVYSDVPAYKFEEFLLASSKGTYFNTKIKDDYIFSAR